MLRKFIIFSLLITSIISIFTNKNKSNNVTIEIIEGEKEITISSDIKLINVSSNIKEYHDCYRSFEFSFDKDLATYYLKNFKYSDEKKKIHTAKLEECKKINNIIKCNTDLSIKSGTYKIINLLYNDKLIKTKGNIYFTVKEDIIPIERAFDYTGTGVHNDKFNILGLQFENIAYPKYFSAFLFTNSITHKIYNVDYKFMHSNGGSVSQVCIFDFRKLPPGSYYISFIYKRKMQNTKQKIIIEPFIKLNECDLYPD
jgi:hypothetical protein